jgi:hypothetical protein
MIFCSTAADCPNDEGKKKPQLLGKQPYVVAAGSMNVRQAYEPLCDLFILGVGL